MKALGFADRLYMCEIVTEESEMTPKILFCYWKDEVINWDEEDCWERNFCQKNQNSVLRYAKVEMAIRKQSSCQVDSWIYESGLMEGVWVKV